MCMCVSLHPHILIYDLHGRNLTNLYATEEQNDIQIYTSYISLPQGTESA